ncbi:MAG: hypothetical protein AAFX86_10665 [Pseudomonadota bacterium]
MMEERFSDARYAVMHLGGYGLDSIGALERVELLRQDGEADQAYRERLIVKLDWLCGVGKTVSSIAAADFLKYREWFEERKPIEVDGLRYLVQAVSFENGRFSAQLAPLVPLRLPPGYGHEKRKPVAYMPFGAEGEILVALPEYAGRNEAEVLSRVMARAIKEGYQGTAQDRLFSLGWIIKGVYAE